MRPEERVDDLQRDGLSVIQRPDWFCFGIDAVLLADFVRIKRGGVAVEFGTGTAVIPLLLTAKTAVKKIIAFEVQKEVADLAGRNIALNGLSEQIEVIADNLNRAKAHLPAGSADVVFSNPPYMAAEEGIVSPHPQKRISRHELTFSIDELFESARWLLRDRGDLFLIHRPHRLVDLFVAARAHALEPKTIRMVHPRADEAPNIVLLHFKKRGRPELKFQDPLVVYDKEGAYTEEIVRIYGQVKIDRFEGR